MFRSLFNRKEDQHTPEFLNLTLGRSFGLDAIELKLLPHDTLFVPPANDMNIVAQGFSDLGEQSFLHRFYPDDDAYILQIQGGDGRQDDRVDEIVLWYVYDVHYLSRESAWTRQSQLMKRSYYEIPCEGRTQRFERVWFDHSNEDEEPMTHWETVKETRDQTSGKAIFQSAMLYGRALSDGSDEMLLVNMEQPDHGEKAVSFLLGRALAQHALKT